MKSIRSDQLIELGCVEQLLLEFYARWLILSRWVPIGKSARIRDKTISGSLIGERLHLWLSKLSSAISMRQWR